MDWCIMCRHWGETVAYFLLHCEMAYWLWIFVFITLECLGLYLDRSQICFLASGIGWGSTRFRYGIWFCCAFFGVFGRNRIGGLLRIWIVPMIRCLLLLVELFLIGLGHGDSQLVILSLFFLALFLFVINMLIGFLFCFFSVFFFLYFLGLLYVFHA